VAPRITRASRASDIRRQFGIETSAFVADNSWKKPHVTTEIAHIRRREKASEDLETDPRLSPGPALCQYPRRCSLIVRDPHCVRSVGAGATFSGTACCWSS